ncbi:HpcH/HpaI aldolase/citrate lyase family protein [Halalkalicoccus sp. NIPERK01]|uniref:HpcH/HpaI aldolase family protein n=1 Tax=Halalkalicoccus sp. NIPERK01 TaxID=3053469 RepID=UPI00256F50D1|nr:aldolase/citrate lyase family protein [Halalkalicoccus sp. NIPERK01]MDL5363252.1 aldolase/citrate lyase family protein [Halalkalicoccus sp. NIPERK01]
MTDRTKEAIESGAHPIGTWISIGHPTVAEVNARLGLDFLVIDIEHTTINLETVEDMARAVDAAPGETDTVVRVPWNDPVRIKRVIDIGVAGIMVPMIGSAKEARDLVNALRYPPEGIRGIAGSRATGYGRNMEEYVTTANGSILTIAQIETEDGLDNVAEIANVDGIDALFVGPADLSGTLGMFAEWEREEFRDAVEHVIETGHEAGVPVGTLTVDLNDIESTVRDGFDFLIAGKDTTQMMESTERAIETYENALASSPVSDR